MRRWFAASVFAIGMGSLGGLVGCAHGVTSAWTATRASGDRVEVKLHGDVAIVGEKVDVYRRVCPHPPGQLDSPVQFACTREFVGHGEVVDELGYQRAVVQMPPGVQFEPGMTIERPST